MRLNPRTWPIFSAEARQKKIDPKPAYQRGPVWSQAQQQLFIDSILRGYDIPKLYLRSVSGADYEWEIIDGQQRLRAIWQFIDNRYPLSDDSDPVAGHKIAGKVFSDLHDDLQQEFRAYELSVIVVEDAVDDDIEDMFLRLQNGVPLNSAEKRNAISGQIRNFIRQVADTHKLMTTSVPFKNNRYSHDEVVAQMMLIELTGGPTSIRHNNLKTMYQSHKRFKIGSAQASKLRAVMKFLSKAFPRRTPELNKVNLVSLYIVVSELLTKYSLGGRENEFAKWFFDFERRRKSQDEIGEDQRDESFESYELAINQQTANVASQEVRRKLLLEDLLEAIPDLTLLDNRRQFTEEQRITIYRRFDGKCTNPEQDPDCVVDCDWGNWHADHIIPHSRGGPTSVANGQLLCPPCNLKKAAA